MDSPTPVATESGGFKFALRALRYRNYRLFFLGQGVSLIGTWLTTTATSWLVLQLAHKFDLLSAATVMGVVRFAALVPVAILAPAAGVLIDRWNRHRVLVVTQALSMIQSGALAVLTFSKLITVPQIIGLSLFQGLINAFDAPARQAFVVEMVEDRADLPNAIALNSSMFNSARLLGPAVAGILTWKVGEAICFAIDAVSYLAVLIALLMMRLKPHSIRVHQNGALQAMREGFAYAIGFAPVTALLLLAAVTSFAVEVFQTLQPLFAEAIAAPEQGAAAFGFLGTAIGVGALAGAVYLATRRTVVGLGTVIAISAALSGAAMIGFGITHSFIMMLATSTVCGFGMIVTFAASNTILQTLVEDDMRGRLMSFFVVAVMGAAPVGSLAGGWLADRVGESWTIVVAIAFLIKLPSLRVMVRPILVRRGVIPEVAEGLAVANRVNASQES